MLPTFFLPGFASFVGSIRGADLTLRLYVRLEVIHSRFVPSDLAGRVIATKGNAAIVMLLLWRPRRKVELLRSNLI